ncbi:F0F1 ATP synthase subunit B [Crassaminicella profunda]|uniref:F0F1 ATP synthase subunit B n=1 Tax=Crassaminicella profunda TaxID=1286698 RepID=UPI001CA6D012|nr:F0F1 ATP synthase subunit B [Crassaminicella profunda]QZY55523.1 F0F1 ATP synthase subunit B [Crassaminicella profunda]
MTGLVELNWTTAFQIINTIVLFLALKKFLFKPVTEFMQSRQDGILASIKEAEEKNKEADQRKKEYKTKLEFAEEEGREIIKEASKKAEKRASEIVKEAENNAAKMMKRAEAETKRQNEKAMNELKNEISSLAVMAAGKIIDKSLDEKEHHGLIKEFIDEVGDAKWQN